MGLKLTDEQNAKLREVFALFDKEGNGCVEAKDLGAVFREMGQNPSEGALAEMLKEAGISESGEVEFPTCCEMLQEHTKEQEQQLEDMRQAFRQLFDKENTGAVRASELHATLTCMGEKISNGELDELIQLAEKDETGLILIESFIDIMIAKPT
ncbi:uncharacterized protein LOC135484904 isoform X2 [Lineus longissimus]|uniref:uncharacterized protein LOC135484904 isoform X2 n=1 Tax=Lineus longissimus TaxID=88925 RepID=UPI002B4E5A9B